jgi:hypothetical protein
MSLALNGCHAGSVPVVLPAGRLTGASTLDGENETPHGVGPDWLAFTVGQSNRPQFVRFRHWSTC